MMQKDPRKRPSAEECLKHAWLTLNCDEKLNIKVLRENSGLTSTAMRLNERKTQKEQGKLCYS